LPDLSPHEFGPPRLLPSAHGEFRACRLCGASRGVYETGETIWLDLDGSELPGKVAHNLEQQCPGPSGRLRDHFGVGRSAVASLATETANAERPVPGARILVVDDDLDARNALADVLEDEGYIVACARNGKEALEHLRAQPRPSLVILDLLMPEMDGWQFRTEQMRDPAISGIPVVVLTALHQTREFDCSELLHKPADLNRLLQVLSRYCAPVRSRS
jgi:CheY-like chemotaxis protein